jgi:hypothetical protein
MRVGKRFTTVSRVGCAMNLSDGDLHSALPIHVTLRHKLKVQSTTLENILLLKNCRIFKCTKKLTVLI